LPMALGLLLGDELAKAPEAANLTERVAKWLEPHTGSDTEAHQAARLRSSPRLDQRDAGEHHSTPDSLPKRKVQHPSFRSDAPAEMPRSDALWQPNWLRISDRQGTIPIQKMLGL
jgi:hypothetical protein